MTVNSYIKLRKSQITKSQKCVKLQQFETERDTTMHMAVIPIPPEVVKTNSENEPCLILPDQFFIHTFFPAHCISNSAHNCGYNCGNIVLTIHLYNLM